MSGKNIIVGIAGHVGHGKTTLAGLLTGTGDEHELSDKYRQRTVETNILPLGLHEDFSVTILDVPGHGRYLKNTIRGLSGVDMAILVVAADDGIMPRTLEHLRILEFLGVGHGFVVLTKCDLVDRETISLAKLEIQEAVHGSFLANPPIVPFTPGDKGQLNRIIRLLEKAAAKITGKNPHGPFRLWVDRICSFTGHGTVVCGTVQQGQVHEGDSLELFPGGIQTRARSLEVHRQKVSVAMAGHQVGINLPKIPVKFAARGMMLCAPGSIGPRRFLNVEFHLSRTVSKPLQNHQKVLVYLGTGISFAQAAIMDSDKIEPGGFALVQFRLKTPLPSMAGDHVVITSQSEKMVLGGGKVLEASLFRFRRSKADNTIAYLKSVLKKDLAKMVCCYMNFFPHRPVTAQEVSDYSGFDVAAVQEAINQLMASGKILPIGIQGFYSIKLFGSLKKMILGYATELLENNLLKESVNIEELRNRAPKNYDKLLYQNALESLCLEKKLIREAAGYQPVKRTGKLKSSQIQLVGHVFQFAENYGIMPFSAGQLFEFTKRKYSKREIQKILAFLAKQGKLIRLSDDRFLTLGALEEVKQRVQKIVAEKKSFAVSDSNKILGFGRTKGAPIFDYLDHVGFTKREGNLRTLK